MTFSDLFDPLFLLSIRIAIVLMIFCNSGAGHYDFLEHKVWNGLNLADFIFPSFLWIMGVCVPMAMKSQMTRGVPKSKMLGTILRVIKFL